MKKIILTILLALCGALALDAQQDNDLGGYLSKIIGREDVYYFRSSPSDIYGRFNNPAPVFMIFPDARTGKEEAERMVEESGIRSIIDRFSGSVYFFNPLGETYDNAKDFEAYEAFINRMRIAFNIKVVGIGNGATFVNETIARKGCNVAGFVSIGGKAPKKAVAGESPAPAYIIGKDAAKTASSYIARDNVQLVSRQGTKSIYTNPDEPLMKVVVNTEKDISDLRAVFADAWESLLSWNYRFNNYKHTWYTGEGYGEHGDSELEPFLIFDRMGITRNVVTQDLTGQGEFLWYEYIPDAAMDAAPGTVPLVVLLHGNENDPRTQAETSGFLPVAAKEGFMVAEFEWQGGGWTPMGHDGIETVIYELFRKYPQIDRSRVYAEGLSAGAFNATALGIKKTHVFAAVGAQSGGIMEALRFGSSRETLYDEAALKSDGCDMPYFSINGTDDDAVIYPTKEGDNPNRIHLAWMAYQMLNNLPVYKNLDFSIDPFFGMALENRQRVKTNKNIYYETGDQTRDGIPLIRYVTVDGYAHWNFQPGAQLMWDYFKMFSRDPQTKRLIYHR